MNRHIVGTLGVACLLLFWFSIFASAQQPVTGIPPLSSVAGGPFDTVDLANLDVHFAIPVFSRPGKGMPFSYALTYDSLVWSPKSATGASSWTPVTGWGWSVMTQAATGYVTYDYVDAVTVCGSNQVEYEEWANWVYHDPQGTPHPFLGSYVLIYDDPGCGIGHTFTMATATDNSGYILHLPTIHTGETNVPTTVTSRSGMIYYPPSESPTGAGKVIDPNGNTINVSAGNVITDTLGTTALTISGTNPVTYSYTAPGATAQVKVNYLSYMVATHFNVPGIADYYYPNGIATSLVSSITLPDNSQYTFTYEPTSGGAQGTVTGRIASVTLPTGGTINYSYAGTSCYNNNNCMMADGSPSSMARTLGGGTWNYTRGYQTDSSHPTQTTTTVLDPASPQNETDFRFSGVYLTDKAVYQGAKSSLLDYSYICYDPNAHYNAGCPTATVTAPITWMATADALNNMTYGSTLFSGIWNYYDSYGNLTQELDYDYGISTHTLLRNKITSYSTALCSNYSICDHPSSVQVFDGASTSKSYTTYAYDEDNHTHGSATTISRSSTGLTAGPFLAQHYSYDSGGTGTLASATDPKGTTTTYNYTSGSCNYAFPASVTAHNLTTNYVYDCRGGVVTSVTDPNLAIVSTTYSDHYYWRPASVTDQAGKITNISYPAVGQVESVMLFNSNFSTYDFVTIADTYGRAWLRQKREGPAPGWTTFDTSATDYDVAGRVLSVTSQPASCTFGNDCTTAKATTTYDGAGRPLLVTAADGGTVGYAYTQNDVLYTVGPAHDGEITKSRNFEYDALGRLTSVCEVTGSGASGCGSQTSPPAHGYMTTYGYDPLGDLITVSQGSTQTRTYNYDGIARMLKEVNTENGTTNYTYDTDSTCSSSAGDMVKKVNAAGTTCFYYDALHRLTDAGNGYEGGSPVCRRYRYDSAIVNGVTMSNVSGRLAETKTDNCGSTQLTDEGFSYSPRGEITDVYQSSPHSGGYYHVSSFYWDNGMLETISGVPGVPTITYGANQGGAPYTVSASSGQNPITYAAYNAARQLINLTLGSGDTDSFGYDSQTGRFTQYKYNVGTTPQTVEGDLTWNQNGTLKQLAITDGTNSANSQTCKYVYDDLARVSTVNCQNTALQNVWNQIFGYDVSGILRRRSHPEAPVFRSNRHIPQTPTRLPPFRGVTVTYDPNGDGNLLQDGAHTYTWDVNWGNVASIDTVGLTFDALGSNG